MEPRPIPDALDADVTSALPPGSVGQPLPEGHVLGGRYRLQALIGAGGMGHVYRARDLALERDVAVKLLAGPDTRDARERFLREARSAAALNHPHIVAVHDLGDVDGRLFLVMELVAGGSLRDAQLSSVSAAVEVARQLAAALGHAHAHGLVHRDVKPANVLVQEAGERPVVKLADLGLAVSSSRTRLTVEGAIVGTVAYLAPEQALGRGVDARADLYSLGVLLYEMVAGRLPFEGTPIALISQHLHAPVVPPRSHRPDLDPALDAIILRLLAKDPAQRFPNAAALLDALAPSLAAHPSLVVQASTVGSLDALVRGRLVGRDQELDQLRELWRRAVQRNGHLALVSGEAGAGKTRLANELAVYARLGGALALYGGCYEYEATTPYLPFVEALRRWVRDAPGYELSRALGDKAAVLARLAPEIETRLGPLPTVAPLAAHEERLRLFDHVARWLQAIAGTHGALLLLDDLQWADQGTLQLLHYVLRHLQGEPLLVLATCREEEVGPEHPLSMAFEALQREHLATRLHLARLDLAGTAAVLAALSGQTSVSDDLAAAIFRETEGNPFFIEETVKALVEQGVMYRRDGLWYRDETVEIRVPEGVRSLIARRIERLSATCRDALHTAAALGKLFAFDELHAVLVGEEEILLDAVEEARKSQLLLELSDERFAFTHDKIREVLYDGSSPIRRRRLHRQIGDRLLAHFGEARAQRERAAALAHHFHQGGDHERALDWSLRAAGQAQEVYAPSEASEYLAQALACARALDRGDDECRIERALGRALEDVGDNRAAAGHFERALELTRDTDERLVLEVEIGVARVQIGDPGGREHLRRALAGLDPQRHPLETARATGALGRYEHLYGQHARAVELLQRAWALAEPLADLRTEEHIISWLAGAYQHLGEYRQSDVWAQRCVERGQATGAPHLEAIGWEFLAENQVNCRPARALEHARRDFALGERVQASDRMAWAGLVSGWALSSLGRLAESQPTLERALELARRVGETRVEPLIQARLVTTLVARDDRDAAGAVVESSFATAEASGLVWLRLEARRAWCEWEVAYGDLERAVTLAGECTRLLAGSDSRQNPLMMGALHAEALRRLGRRDEALAVLDENVDANRRADALSLAAEALRQRAILHRERGAPDAALRDVEESLRLAHEVESDLAVARALAVRASLAARAAGDASVDRERASELLTRCGARRDLAQLAG